MDSLAEIIIKIILVVVLLTAFIVFWIIPRTKLVERFKPDHNKMEKLFNLISITGIITGAAGLLLTYIFKQKFFILHLWELVLIPFFLVHLYMRMLHKIKKVKKIQYDEKQQIDLTRAAATAWIATLVILMPTFICYNNNILTGLYFFPIIFFGSILVYSIAALYYSKH